MFTPLIHPEWQEVLSKVQQYFPGAKIAGGALRDTLLGLPVKDVDIFIPVGFEFNHREHLPKELIEAFNLVLVNESVYGKNNDDIDPRNILCVMKNGITEARKEFDYDFIFGEPGACDMRTFDLSVCQIAYGGKDVVETTNAFLESLTKREVYVMNVNRADRQKARLERILGKLTDFKYGGERVPKDFSDTDDLF